MRTVSGPTESVVIVGAGLGGLSAALHLAAAGRSVTVVEREDVPGGRCGLISEGGYHFDTGPTVLTMPELLAEPFHAVGEELHDWLELIRLDPAYRARFADGSQLEIHADVEVMADQITKVCGAKQADGYRRFVHFARELYALELPHFIDRNLDSPLQLIGAPAARLVAMGAFRRLDNKVGDFVTDERLRRILTFQSMYAGMPPAKALAIYCVITYMDAVRGVYFPVGGMHAVPRAMAAAAARHGVTFRYGTEVASVELQSGRATGVITNAGERIDADVVVVNADLPTAYRELLPPGHTPRRVKKLRYSPSAVVLHTGTARTSAQTFMQDPAHHVIDFGAAWESTFEQIVNRGEVMRDPSFMLTTPTLTDPSLAPAGRHAHYALFPAPNLDHRQGLDWSELAPRYRDTIVETLQRRGYAGFGDGAEVERIVTPLQWRAQGMTAGAPFAAAHSFSQTGPFRAPTLDRSVPNLVFAGSNTQPGVGVPMVLISGKLAAARITG
jgi:phytoene desaturase